ncbi:MAG: class I SAM-dependent methyltransferase [Anaerolineales bacterium]|nr:class I SAM-dependent methyltransferase [Anaerolineales bacterium]
MSRDYLGQHLRDLPYFRALLRAVEALFYQDLTLPAPALDLGCGDGHFATLAFDRRLEVGVDPWWGPLQEAAERRAYQHLLQTEGAALPFPDAYFASAVSNSVLEHIPHLDSVLLETARVLQPGAPFIFCVPNHRFLATLSVGRALDRLQLHSLANAYRAFFNRISRHHHCDAPEVWQPRLAQAGFALERYWHYFSPAALRTLEWGHYFGLPSLVSKKLTGRWLLSQADWNLALTRRLATRAYSEPLAEQDGAYTFYIARRV